MISHSDQLAEQPQVPDYLPARMLNEFVYCPRLFYYQWVESLFAHNRETVEGSLRHEKIDAHEEDLPTALELVESAEACVARSIELASDEHRLIAKMDLVEARDGRVTPVDYKRGSPRLFVPPGESAGAKSASPQLTAWDTDRIQIAAQAIVLRANGYRCEEGVIYYAATKQRVRIPIDESLIQETLAALQGAWLATSQPIPPPLVDSPKCPRCSLVTICLPDETRSARVQCTGSSHRLQRLLFDLEDPPPSDPGTGAGETPSGEVRRLVPARDDQRPLYLNSQGMTVGKSGNVLKIKDRDKVVSEVRIGEICQVNLYGGIQMTTQAVQTLCENEVPIALFSQGGWFYGVTQGLGARNVELRRKQYRLADSPSFCLRLARSLVVGKIRNQRTMLQRNHIEPPADALASLKYLVGEAERAESLASLLGIEGNAARVYFEQFAGMIKTGKEEEAFGMEAGSEASSSEMSNRQDESGRETDLTQSGVQGLDQGSQPVGKRASRDEDWLNFNFKKRNRRPPRDPVNALLSLAYSVLAKDLTITCHTVGLDPFLGFYHQPRFGRAALAVDLMEPFRPLIADSAVLSVINTRMIAPNHFVRAGEAVSLNAEGRRAFFRAYEQRMDGLVTHPMFGYRVSYRRILEIQVRLLARVLTGEIADYPPFTTR